MSETKKKLHTSNDVTEQILFCQNGINNLHVLSKDISNEISSEETNSINEELMVDIVSNGYKYENSSLKLNQIQQCYVVSIISPYAFTIQLIEDINACEQFFKNLNDYYNSIDDLQISEEYLRANLLCVTWDENASAWNRSQIMEYDLNQDTVNVFFVDLNSWEENVSRSRIRFILTKYSSRPVCLLTCRLASIAPINNNNNNNGTNQWNDVVIKTFQNVVCNCQCDIELLYKRSDNIFYVNLFAPHDEAYVCINDFLIHCKMARPIDDSSNDDNISCMLDEDGKLMHSMIALYWKAGETEGKNQEDEHQSTISTVSSETKSVSLTKVVRINDDNKIIFARYKSYIMLPWFTISNILNEFNENQIKNLANKFGFKPIVIDPLSDPLLSSQLLKLITPKSISTRISLYSIDCVKKILQTFHYQQPEIFDLLDKARLAEASDDPTFWNKSYEEF